MAKISQKMNPSQQLDNYYNETSSVLDFTLNANSKFNPIKELQQGKLTEWKSKPPKFNTLRVSHTLKFLRPFTPVSRNRAPILQKTLPNDIRAPHKIKNNPQKITQVVKPQKKLTKHKKTSSLGELTHPILVKDLVPTERESGRSIRKQNYVSSWKQDQFENMFLYLTNQNKSKKIPHTTTNSANTTTNSVKGRSNFIAKGRGFSIKKSSSNSHLLNSMNPKNSKIKPVKGYFNERKNNNGNIKQKNMYFGKNSATLKFKRDTLSLRKTGKNKYKVIKVTDSPQQTLKSRFMMKGVKLKNYKINFDQKDRKSDDSSIFRTKAKTKFFMKQASLDIKGDDERLKYLQTTRIFEQLYRRKLGRRREIHLKQNKMRERSRLKGSLGAVIKTVSISRQ